MPQFETHRLVKHSPDRMYDLVADVEKYPQFLPLCEALTVRSRKERDGKILLVADMTVGYKAIRETFTTQVLLNPAERAIDVKYIDGPFKYLENRWRFEASTRTAQPFISSSTMNSRTDCSARSWDRCSTGRSACSRKLSRPAPTRFMPTRPD